MADENKFQRQIAYKVQIVDILRGSMVFEADRFLGVDSEGKRIGRVNMIANVIDKYSNPEKQFASLTLDDGSGQIRLKGFSDSFAILSQPMIGDTVYVIGVMRFFNNELYVMPELIRSVTPKWLTVRKLELGIEEIQRTNAPAEIRKESVMAKNPVIDSPIVTQQKIELPKTVSSQVSSPKLNVLGLIKKDKEIDMERIIIALNVPLADLNVIVKELIAEGEIYESRPGHLCAMS